MADSPTLSYLIETKVMLQEEASIEAEAGSSSARFSLDDEAAPQDPNPDSPRVPATHGFHPNPSRVPNRSSLKGGNSNLRRKPQMDPITESSSDQQDSLGNEEELLQVNFTFMPSA